MVQSHALLHYSVLKNLAELAEKENNVDLALEYYMEVPDCNRCIAPLTGNRGHTSKQPSVCFPVFIYRLEQN